MGARIAIVRSLALAALLSLAAAWSPPAGSQACTGGHGLPPVTDTSAYLTADREAGATSILAEGSWRMARPSYGPEPGDAGTTVAASPARPAVFVGSLQGPVSQLTIELYSMVAGPGRDARPLQLRLDVDGVVLTAGVVPTLGYALGSSGVCHAAPVSRYVTRLVEVDRAMAAAGLDLDPAAVHQVRVELAPALGADTVMEVYAVDTLASPSRLVIDERRPDPWAPAVDIGP